MSIPQRISHWHHAHQYLLHTILRVILGLILLFKAIYFISNASELEALIRSSRLAGATGFLIFYITVAHLLGGAFIVLGLLFRTMILLQLPILTGALIFIFPSPGATVFLPDIFSLAVLALLVFFLLKGPGPIAMDNYRKDHLL
jgi:putative oxidoreductase